MFLWKSALKRPSGDLSCRKPPLPAGKHVRVKPSSSRPQCAESRVCGRRWGRAGTCRAERPASASPAGGSVWISQQLRSPSSPGTPALPNLSLPEQKCSAPCRHPTDCLCVSFLGACWSHRRRSKAWGGTGRKLCTTPRMQGEGAVGFRELRQQNTTGWAASPTDGCSLAALVAGSLSSRCWQVDSYLLPLSRGLLASSMSLGL